MCELLLYRYVCGSNLLPCGFVALTKEDVPEIYALHPFVNAAIKSLDVKYMGHVAAGLTINEESAGTMFRWDINSFVSARNLSFSFLIANLSWWCMQD